MDVQQAEYDIPPAPQQLTDLHDLHSLAAKLGITIPADKTAC
jgi:hypothetical protein